MTRAQRLAFFAGIGCAVLMGVVQAMTERIRFDAVWDISAGDAWELAVIIADGEAGDPVTVILFNGLQTFSETLTLGTGGVAVWRLPAGTITQAGESLVMVRHAADVRKQGLHVRADFAVDGDFFATGNTLMAYGESKVTLLLLPRDEWGNAADESSRFFVDIRYPNSTQVQGGFVYTGGVGRYTFASHGEPGRIRLTLADVALALTLELMQTAGEPALIDLQIEPDCIDADGRDLVSLVATVRDSHDVAVVDGTLVTFTWAAGQGYGYTVGGQAILRIPVPRALERFAYRAAAMNAESSPAYLRVVQGDCDE